MTSLIIFRGNFQINSRSSDFTHWVCGLLQFIERISQFSGVKIAHVLSPGQVKFQSEQANILNPMSDGQVKKYSVRLYFLECPSLFGDRTSTIKVYLSGGQVNILSFFYPWFCAWSIYIILSFVIWVFHSFLNAVFRIQIESSKQNI